MAELKTPTRVRTEKKVTDRTELNTPVKIPASPFLQQIGYGTGIAVYMMQRSPKVGCFARSPWAIKKWVKGRSSDVNNSHLRLEADILRQLNHPNIVGFRAFTTGPDGKPCLAMEAVDMSLGDKIDERQELLEDEPFPAKDIMKVAFEVAKGLKYLHNTAHVLHGDIKSWNILVSDAFEVVKICDFGNSLPLTESLEVDMSKGDFSYVGTECWNPPEVIENGPITSAADIWPYGLVLWEMISLSVPHAEHLDENELNESITESIKTLDESDVDMNESDSFLKRVMPCTRNVIGTRPALPAIELGKEYERILEVFFICTIEYKLRPSAKALVNYFEKCQSANVTKKL
ncbi:hypothetical protein HN011_005472 [Eciton burchellii]|nr:hypothetical protein HN011_005472 [Eciton burchellii]